MRRKILAALFTVGLLVGLAGLWSTFAPQILIAAKDSVWELHPGGSSRDTAIIYIPTAGTSILPGTDNNVDIGSSSLEFKDAYFDGTVTADAVTNSGVLTQSSTAIFSAATIQTLRSTHTITTATPYIVLGSTGGALTLTSTPNISTASATSGQFIIVASTVASITLQDQATLDNSGLALSAASVAIGTSTARMFIFDGTNSVWKQIEE